VAALSRPAIPAEVFFESTSYEKVVSDHHPKPNIVVPVVRVVPVAVRTTHVPLIVVERAATQHAVAFGPPPQPTASRPWIVAT
jgi:hypothetical protein